MDKERQDLRRAAAQAFLESLNNLEDTLRFADSPSTVPTVADTTNRPVPPAPRPEPAATPAPPPNTPRVSSGAVRKPMPLSMADFEQAVADIEQYMQAQQSEQAE